MSEGIIVLEIILFCLCFLGGISILVFLLRKCDDGMDYNRIIRELNEQKAENLDKINKGNKQIDEIEEKILKCKRKLDWKLFKNKK